MTYQPKTGAACGCKPGRERDNCPRCEGTGQVIDFAAIRARAPKAAVPAATHHYLHAVPDTKVSRLHEERSWLLVTSDQADAVTINARVIAEGLTEYNAKSFAAALNAHEKLVAALRAFPQPGLPGRADWQEQVVAWWNNRARAALAEVSK